MTRTEPTLLYLVKQVELAIRDRLDELVRPHGITTLQYTALTVLEAQDDLTSAQLARRSFVTPQSTSDLVAALLARDLVERHRDAADGRRLVIGLTSTGRRLLRRLRPGATALEAEMLGGLTETEAAALRTTLDTARAALDRRST